MYQAFCEETGSSSKKRTPKGKKARTNKKRKVIKADLRDLSKDALNKMKENEMLNALFKDNIQRLRVDLRKLAKNFHLDLLLPQENQCGKNSTSYGQTKT